MKKSRFILPLLFIASSALTPVGKADWSALKKSDTLSKSASTAVCYIGNTKFTTLDNALDWAAANPGSDEIYVIPGLNPKISGLTISNDHTISEGDSLILPIAFDDEGVAIVLDETGTNDGEFADTDEATNLKTRIALKAGKTLTINGTLEIGAVTGSKEANKPMGQASGAYCELLMGSNSSLTVNGTLNCYGFIKESVQDESAIKVNSGGKIETPVVFYDHDSGSTSFSISKNGVFPYKQFDMPQIRSEMTFEYGSSLFGRIHLYGSSMGHQTTSPQLIGTTSSFINMDGQSASLVWRFSDSQAKGTDNSLTTHKTSLTLYGTQSFGSLSVTLSYNEIQIPISSANYYLPIPVGYSIIAEKDAILTLPEKIGSSTIRGVKFMPGSSLTCRSKSTINFNSNVLFYQNTTASDASTFDYPSNSAAKCLNDGTMNINKGFEGNITTSSDSEATIKFGKSYAQIDISNKPSKELTNSDGYYTWGGAFGKIKEADKESPSDKAYFANSKTYTSAIGEDYWNEEITDIDSVEIAYCKTEDVETSTSIASKKHTVSYDKNASSYVVIFEAKIDPEKHGSTNVEYQWDLSGNRKVESTTKTVDNYSNRIKVILPKNETKDETDSYTLKISVSFTKMDNSEGSVTDSITIEVKGPGCILPTAKILMADGTYKQAGSIKTGDMVISFNHETGKFEPNLVIGNDHSDSGAEMRNVVHLEFSNGRSTDLIYEHGYFDKTLNKYVYLHEDDFADYIGHEFVFYENGLATDAKLVAGSISEVFTTLAAPATANHLNLVVDDMLSIEGGLSGLFNIFEYDHDTLAFDKEKMDADIQEYGLLRYESFEKYFPKEIYDLLPCKYLGVSIGKGLITWDVFEGYVNKWKDQLMENLL